MFLTPRLKTLKPPSKLRPSLCWQEFSNSLTTFRFTYFSLFFSCFFSVNFDFPDLDDEGKKIIPPDTNGLTSFQNGLSLSNVPPTQPLSSSTPQTIASTATAMPKIDRSLKPSLATSVKGLNSPSSNGALRSNNATIDEASTKTLYTQNGKDFGSLYPKVIAGVAKPANKPSSKNINIINDNGNQRDLKSTFKNDQGSDLLQSVQLRKQEEANLAQFRLDRDDKLVEDERKLEEMRKSLQQLEMMKKKEQKDVVDLMRMKRKMKEELDAEKTQVEEDRQRLAMEEQNR